MAPTESNDEPDKHKRYYNSKKADPEFRARNAERVRKYRARKAEEESIRCIEKAAKKQALREKKKERKRLAACNPTDCDVVAVSNADNQNPHPPPINPCVKPPIYDALYGIRRFIASWNKDWGPVVFWPHEIRTWRQNAVHAKSEREWKNQMVDKVTEGLWALAELRGFFVQLPQDPWQVRDLWFQVFDLTAEIQAGIACLQAHLCMYAD